MTRIGLGSPQEFFRPSLARWIYSMPRCGFHLGFSLVLTDGETWQIYDLGKRGRFQNKIVEHLSIGESSAASIAKTLNQALRRNLHWKS